LTAKETSAVSALVNGGGAAGRMKEGSFIEPLLAMPGVLVGTARNQLGFIFSPGRESAAEPPILIIESTFFFS
jgi:hypothetical protein